MPKTPEPLDAVLAEMRKAVVPMICGRPKIEAVSIRDVLQWADRIEAAAARERNAHTNDIHNALYMATGIPGNAAAMRESIETMRRYAMLPQEELSLSLLQRTIHEKCDAALSAPTRNCDRFATELDARLAWKRETKCKGDYRYWLFAPAEGKEADHA